MGIEIDFSEVKKVITKTCCEWYAEDKVYDILDADGFHRHNKYAGIFWNYVPVPYEYYKSRRNMCTIKSFNIREHYQPFIAQKGDAEFWEKAKKHPLVDLMFDVISAAK
jgi:hypothetical protein